MYSTKPFQEMYLMTFDFNVLYGKLAFDKDQCEFLINNFTFK